MLQTRIDGHDHVTVNGGRGGAPPLTWIKKEVSLGNLLLLAGLFVSVGAGIWQGGELRATLESGIRGERDLRIADTIAIGGRLDGLQADIRELRGILMATQANPAQRPRER